MTQPLYVPSSGGDDGPAINAAFASSLSVVLGAETYNIATTIVVPPQALLSGQARATRIRKIANIDMLDLRYCAGIQDFALDGDGDNFSGRGVVIRADQHYQRMVNVHVNSRDYCVHFEANNAGTHMKIEDCFITRYPSLTSYSIKLPDSDDLTSGNRILRDIRSSGGYGVDLAGAHNTVLDRANMAQIRMDPALRTLILQNSRIGGKIEFHGSGIWAAFNNVSNGININLDVLQSLFIATISNAPITRADLAGNGNSVW